MQIFIYICIKIFIYIIYLLLYIGDSIVIPPEHCDHFSEKLILLPHTYLVNDYALLQGNYVVYILVLCYVYVYGQTR